MLSSRCAKAVRVSRSFRPSHGWIRQKRLKLGLWNFHLTVGSPITSICGVSYIKKLPRAGMSKKGGVEKSHFLTLNVNISKRKEVVQSWLIGNRICAFDWHQDRRRWPWMTWMILLKFRGISRISEPTTAKQTRKPCCRRESARCRSNFRSIDQDMINKDQWRTDFKLSYVTYLLNL